MSVEQQSKEQTKKDCDNRILFISSYTYRFVPRNAHTAYREISPPLAI